MKMIKYSLPLITTLMISFTMSVPIITRDELIKCAQLSHDIYNHDENVQYQSINGSKYLIIRGTNDGSDILTDINAHTKILRISHLEIKIHEGFYQRVREVLGHPNYLLWLSECSSKGSICYITGHPLGGAVSAILSYVIKNVNKMDDVMVISFATPNYMGSTIDSEPLYIDISHSNDIITTLPYTLHKLPSHKYSIPVTVITPNIVSEIQFVLIFIVMLLFNTIYSSLGTTFLLMKQEKTTSIEDVKLMLPNLFIVSVLVYSPFHFMGLSDLIFGNLHNNGLEYSIMISLSMGIIPWVMKRSIEKGIDLKVNQFHFMITVLSVILPLILMSRRWIKLFIEILLTGIESHRMSYYLDTMKTNKFVLEK
jgi:hypothetical protein